MFQNGLKGNSCLQDAPVRKPLFAVTDIEEQGNIVLFSKAGSVIAPITDPVVKQILDLIPKIKTSIKMHKVRGTYKVPAWIKPEAAPVFTRPLR